MLLITAQIFILSALSKDFHPIRNDLTQKIIYWSNFDIENPSSSTATSTPTKLIFVIHGFLRNVADYYRGIEGAAKLNNYNVDNGDIMLLAPKFKTSSDAPDSNDIYYDNGWIYGDMSISTPYISSYAVMDSFLEYILVDQSNVFSSLSQVVLLGHSAGGQFVQRYALTNKLSTEINHKIHFIVANPSSFAYLGSKRWFDGQTYRDLKPYEIAACPDYNKWKYGFADNSLSAYSPYFATDSLENSKSNYIDRTVTYLLGASDVCPPSGSIDGIACDSPASDNNCGDKYQGRFRLERGINFWRSIVELYGNSVQNKQRLQLVPFVGHNQDDMFQSEYSRPVIFNAVIENFSDCGFVPGSCYTHLNWALNTGRYQNPEFYENFDVVAQVQLPDATEADMLLYWYCQGINPGNDCTGLQIPCNRQCN